MCARKTSVARSRTRRAGCPQGADPGCPFFGLPFFGHAKKGDPAAGWPTEPAQDARDAVPNKNWMASSAVGAKKRIPACAGMTELPDPRAPQQDQQEADH